MIRERLEAYAKLFEDRRAGWHLLWVANSPERLARLRQIAGPMKRPTLAGRCWGVPIDEISELGADAEVVGVGANMEPRTLRGLVTDPTARLSDYPVGSPAWIQLLANGGREEINGPWEGVEREPVEAEPVEAEPVEASSVAATTEAKIAVVVEKSLADDQPGIAEAAPGHASRAVLPEPPAAQAEVDADIRLMHGGEFVRLILDAAGEGHRAARAVEFLAERNNTYYLFDELERLCHSGVPEQQLQALRVVRNLRPPEDEWYRQRARELLLRMVDQRNEPAVVKAALAALEARDHPARGVADSGT